MVEELLADRTTSECIALLEGADVPVMPLHDLDSLIDDEHLAAVGLIETVQHPSEGTLRSIRPPCTWSETQPRGSRPDGLDGDAMFPTIAEVIEVDERLTRPHCGGERDAILRLDTRRRVTPAAG